MAGLEEKTFDPPELVSRKIAVDLQRRYSFHSYRGASMILEGKCPDELSDILKILTRYHITKTEIRSPGGSETVFTRRFGAIARDCGWHKEVRIHADLHIQLTEGRSEEPISSAKFIRENFIHGHFIDFWKGRVAFDFEWNSKDQTYDRDLYALRYFFEVGLIDVGVIVTRDLDNDFFKNLGRALDKDGSEKSSSVAAKFGASTTGIGKLISRIASGRSGGCPVLAVGIRPGCITDD